FDARTYIYVIPRLSSPFAPTLSSPVCVSKRREVASSAPALRDGGGVGPLPKAPSVSARRTRAATSLHASLRSAWGRKKRRRSQHFPPPFAKRMEGGGEQRASAARRRGRWSVAEGPLRHAARGVTPPSMRRSAPHGGGKAPTLPTLSSPIRE